MEFEADDRFQPGASRQVSAGIAPATAELLDRLEYRRCDCGEDLEAIFRLRYDSYLATGMVEPNDSRMVIDDCDELPNSYRFGVFIDSKLVSTIRVHHVTQEHPQSPSITVFGDELLPRLASGETFIDPSRFAADLDAARQYRILPYLTLRLVVLACGYFLPTYCLTAIKAEHAAFYKRIFSASEALPPRVYPGLTMPVHLYQSKTADHMANTIERFPFFASTEVERRLLFARAVLGEPSTLNVLPTAKYLRDAA